MHRFDTHYASDKFISYRLESIGRTGGSSRRDSWVESGEPVEHEPAKHESHLGGLRDIFEDPLIERVAGLYIKTARAEQLDAEIRPTLSRLRRALEPSSFDPRQTKAVFRLFASDYCDAVLMPSLIATFTAEAPNTQLEVVRLTKVWGRRCLTVRLISFWAMCFRTGFPWGCENKRLFEDRFVCVMRKSHPVAQSVLSIETFLEYSPAAVDTARGLINWTDAKLHSLGDQRKNVKRSPYVLASLFGISPSGLLQSSPLRLVSSLLDSRWSWSQSICHLTRKHSPIVRIGIHETPIVQRINGLEE